MSEDLSHWNGSFHTTHRVLDLPREQSLCSFLFLGQDHYFIFRNNYYSVVWDSYCNVLLARFQWITFKQAQGKLKKSLEDQKVWDIMSIWPSIHAQAVLYAWNGFNCSFLIRGHRQRWKLLWNEMPPCHASWLCSGGDEQCSRICLTVQSAIATKWSNGRHRLSPVPAICWVKVSPHPKEFGLL